MGELIIPMVTILGIFIANGALIIPLFLWNRAESRADMRHMETKLETYRAETNAILQTYRAETNAMIKAIHDEVTDFHNRLCEIEREFK